MAMVLERAGAPSDAAKAYKKAIKADPKHADAYGYLGILYEDSGDLRKALGHYRKHREHGGADPLVLQRLKALENPK